MSDDTYVITDYTIQRAREIGVDVKPSMKKNKKIDVYKNGMFLKSIGSRGSLDYPTYILLEGEEYANSRRVLYHKRHPNNTMGELLSKWLLW